MQPASHTDAGRPSRAAIILAAVLLVAHGMAYFQWTEDDAGITFRAVENLARGQGLVYNPGERVEGISNLGFALLLLPFRIVLGSSDRLQLLLVAKALGMIAGVLGMLEADRLGAALGLSRRMRTALLFLLAGSAPYAAWTVGALETPLVTWAGLVLLVAAAEVTRGDTLPSPRRATGARLALPATALVLLRPDGFLLPLAIATTLAAGRWYRPALTALLPAATTLGLVAGFRRAYYGDWWPNPVYAKVAMGDPFARAARAGAEYVQPFLLLHGSWVLVLAATLLCLRKRSPRAQKGPLHLTLMAAVTPIAYSVLVGNDWMPHYRFLVPAVVPLLAILMVAATEAVRRSGRDSSPRFGPILVALLVLLEASAGHLKFRQRRDDPFWYRSPTLSAQRLLAKSLRPALWLEQNLASDALLVTTEAGFVPWLTGLRTIDSFGLTDRRLARLGHDEIRRSTLGVMTEFREEEPHGPAEQYLAGQPAAAVLLLTRMVQRWNNGRVPPTLWGGRFRLAADTPLGPIWSLYLPDGATPRQPVPESPLSGSGNR